MTLQQAVQNFVSGQSTRDQLVAFARNQRTTMTNFNVMRTLTIHPTDGPAKTALQTMLNSWVDY